MKKRISAMLLSALLTANICACSYVPKNEVTGTLKNIDIAESNFEETDEKPTENPKSAETVDIEIEYDPATYMRYTLNEDGKSYSVCPAGLPDVIKELVIPGEYKGLPVTKIYGKFLADKTVKGYPHKLRANFYLDEKQSCCNYG